MMVWLKWALAWAAKAGLMGAKRGLFAALEGALNAKQNADTDQARIAADVEIERIKGKIATHKDDNKNWLTRGIRPAFAYPLAAYWTKILVWDKVLGLGATDPLSAGQTAIAMTIVGFFFYGRPAEPK
ncbi:MAG: hypothetical protein K8953_05290 [Proteobacteria bacterium]|nr:hypothetical protein [Pseudomonadota bacterium]